MTTPDWIIIACRRSWCLLFFGRPDDLIRRVELHDTLGVIEVDQMPESITYRHSSLQWLS
jgi:hypothetical protein